MLAAAGIVWLILQLLWTSSGNVVVILVWTFFYFYLLDLSRQHLGRKLDLPRFILWLFIMTVSVTALLLHYNTSREKASRIQLAIKLSKQKDPTLEFNLGMIDTALVKDRRLVDYFRGGRRRNPQAFSRYLLNNYFSNLYSRYEFAFYAYNNKGGVLSSADTAGAKSALDFILQHQSEPASVPDLYYHEVSFTGFSYIARLQVRDPVTDSSLGYFYYRMKPKAIKPETLYPKLLMKSEDNRFESTLNKYSYAVYDHLRLVYNRNDYPFPLHISMKDVPVMDYQFTMADGYSLLWFKPSRDKMVVVVKPNRMLLEAMTLFAYMFCIFLLLIFVLRVFRFLIRARMRPKVMGDLMNMTITMRVQATIIFMIVFVFIVLGISTISFFIRRYDATHRDELVSGMNILLSGVEQAMRENVSPYDPGNPFDPSRHAALKDAIRKIADTHGVDINIYDLDGNLQVSTQNLIYENGLLASKIDPQAYYKLFYLHQVQVIQSEQVGSLKFLSSYAAIRDDNGRTIAFVNQPYFASQVDLKEEISNFLVTLINLNAFIFLLSGLIALLFTNAITRSFSLIGEKLRKVNLSGMNEEIVWEPNDEIGGLVREYNKMVHKLQVSAAALAKSEREGAWREMARQVAHEIKNPLTPMKLSLQHLQRAISQDSPEARRLTKEVARTLIEQIEHLSQIASDFSAFANIAYASNEVLLLNHILASIVRLHHGYDHVDVLYEKPEEEFYVLADKTQLNRLFTNLVQNGMQSIAEGSEGRICVRAWRQHASVIVEVADNGEGIPQEVQPLIFTPNFTTKSSGTGLGLAMCKNIVEQARGRIWFETQVGKGSVFFVQFQLIESPDQQA
jgi:signal transduction histidine kinase